jgi:hypothetical protein
MPPGPRTGVKISGMHWHPQFYTSPVVHEEIMNLERELGNQAAALFTYPNNALVRSRGHQS